VPVVADLPTPAGAPPVCRLQRSAIRLFLFPLQGSPPPVYWERQSAPVAPATQQSPQCLTSDQQLTGNKQSPSCFASSNATFFFSACLQSTLGWASPCRLPATAVATTIHLHQLWQTRSPFLGALDARFLVPSLEHYKKRDGAPVSKRFLSRGPKR
jgi:hypothetical protein